MRLRRPASRSPAIGRLTAAPLDPRGPSISRDVSRRFVASYDADYFTGSAISWSPTGSNPTGQSAGSAFKRWGSQDRESQNQDRLERMLTGFNAMEHAIPLLPLKRRGFLASSPVNKLLFAEISTSRVGKFRRSCGKGIFFDGVSLRRLEKSESRVRQPAVRPGTRCRSSKSGRHSGC